MQLQAIFNRGISVPIEPGLDAKAIVHEYSESYDVYTLYKSGSQHYIYFATSAGNTEWRAVVIKGVVYIAGPMRGLPDCNFPSFDRARDLFIAQGFYVFNPCRYGPSEWNQRRHGTAGSHGRSCRHHEPRH